MIVITKKSTNIKIHKEADVIYHSLQTSGLSFGITKSDIIKSLVKQKIKEGDLTKEDVIEI